jgi:hypothetical protein
MCQELSDKLKPLYRAAILSDHRYQVKGKTGKPAHPDILLAFYKFVIRLFSGGKSFSLRIWDRWRD